MNINRKQVTQVGIAALIVIMIIALVAVGGGVAVEAFKEMHGM